MRRTSQQGRRTVARTLHIYLHSRLRENAQGGRVNIFNRMQAALADWRLVYLDDTEAERLRAPDRDHNLFHMVEPTGPNTLCLRRAYHYPFWRIEATNERWNFDVAKAVFDPASIPSDAAQAFLDRWRPKVFRDGPVTREGFVFIPLQGRISDHRSFQSMRPLAMIETVLELEPKREILATLHPKEVYTVQDLAALAALTARFPRFQLVQRDARDLLGACDYVVTQNSSIALTGYFAGKTAVLFAGIDFHHIAGSVPRDGLAEAFATVRAPLPDFAAYLWWFFKAHCINGGAPEAEAQIRARFRRHGWLT
jgi:hypothetical protein